MASHDCKGGKFRLKRTVCCVAGVSILAGGTCWFVTRDVISMAIAFALPWVVAGFFLVVLLVVGLPMVPFVILLQRIKRHNDKRE